VIDEALLAFDREKTLQIAQKYIERRKYDRAILEYQKVVQHDPNDARTLLRIGDLQARLGAYPQAIATYDRVALYYAGRGFSLKAVAVLKQIRELIDRYAPQLAEQYSHVSPKLAQIYAELGLTNDALATYDGVARRMQATGRDRDAVEIIRRMVALERSNPLSYLRLAEALCRVNRLDEAIEHFWSAAQLLTQQRRQEDAIKVLERILHFRPDTRVARVAAELYIGRGTREAGLLALPRLQTCFEADPRDLDTLALLAQAFQLIGQAPKAIEVYKEMVRISSELGQSEARDRFVAKLQELAPSDEQVRALATLQRARPSLAADAAGAGPASSQPPQSRVSVSPIPVSLAPEGSRRLSEAPTSLRDDEIEFIEESSIDDADDADDDDEMEVEPDIAHAYVEAPTAISQGLPARAAMGSAPELTVDAPESTGQPPGSVRQGPPPGFLKKALVDAESFRGLKLYSKASALLRSVLSLAPNSLEVRAALQQVLLEAGNHPGAIEQMLAAAAIYIKRGSFSAAEGEIYRVLELAPDLPEALRMLREIEEHTGQKPPRSVAGGPRSAPEHEAFELRTRVSRATPPPAAAPEPDGPLPSYRLDDDSRVSSPPGFAAADEPFDSVKGASADLPRFNLDSDAHRAPAAAAEPARAPAVAFASSEDAVDEETAREELEVDSSLATPKPFAGAAAPAAALSAAAARRDEAPSDVATSPVATSPSVSPDSKDGHVREALDEAEFFLSRGLYDDAKTILLDQLQRFPEYPPLLDAMHRLESKLNGESGTRDVGRLERKEQRAPARETPKPNGILGHGTVDAEDLMAALESEGEGEEINVDEVFAKFKEGVKQQISDTDSATHYDLGLAYKEMGLFPDALHEFEIASNDSRRQCNCLAMIGMIHHQQGELDRAAEAYVRGLNCQYKGVEQEMSLYYELGLIYETKNDPDEAIYYLQRIARRDPSYRDVTARLQALLPRARRLSIPVRAINSDQEFDRAFDDMYEDS
jgi:tetratricopeptide (TPR) repeat protein